MRRKGFTLIELLVVIAIIALLVTLLLPKLQQARQLARKSTCMANLKGIGTATELYKESFHKGPPIINSDYMQPEQAIPADATTDDNPNETEGAWDGLGENAMQNVWLLMKEDLLVESGFTCPGDSELTDREGPGGAQPGKYGWSDTDNFSYGMQFPYSEDSLNNQNPWVDDMNGSVVIFADKNPGGPLSITVKPSNHRTLGTAYLIASGSAGFHDERTDSLCGKDGDDIYSIQDINGNTTTVNAVPFNEDDTYICMPVN